MNELTILQTLLGEFHDNLAELQDIVPRTAKFPIAENKIKVAIGMRRTGKTYFIYQEILQQIKHGTPLSQILYINFEDDRLLPLNREKLAKLLEAFYTLYPENHEKKCIFFLDEIQNVEDWPLVIRRFYDSKNCEIFLTGSSAKLLSKEIASVLRGRSLATEIWPYSFQEYLTTREIITDKKIYDQRTKDKLLQLFTAYLDSGGFPEVINYSHEVRQQTLQDYVDLVIYRDIVERHNISNPTLIKYMIMTMIQNVAKPFSINKFYNDIKSQGYKTSKDVLYDYAQYIEDAYLIFSVSLFSESLRQQQVNPKKIYAIDSGLIRSLSLQYAKDWGRIFENLIYLDLRRQAYNVYYYITRERYEVDFLIQNRQGKKALLQVTWDMQDKETKIREERALTSAINEQNVPGGFITIDTYLQGGLSKISSWFN